VGDCPIVVNGVAEIPLTDDFAFGLEAGDFDVAVQIGWSLWEECRKKNHPFVPLSHWAHLEREEGIGYRVHEEVLKRVIDIGEDIYWRLSR